MLATFLVATAVVLAEPAWAGTLEVRAASDPVVVLLDGVVVGSTPVVRTEVAAGPHDLGFRGTAFAQTAFTEAIDVPAEGPVIVFVDLAARTARVDRPPIASAGLGASTSASVVGDLYVSASEPGARLIVDGEEIGLTVPALLKGVSVGSHLIEARTDCMRGSGSADVRSGLVARAELSLLPGDAQVTIRTTPEGARVLVDGEDVGESPWHSDTIACGKHTVVGRAAGFLEATMTIHARAFESMDVAIALHAEEFGTLVLVPSPLDAEVLLDGVSVGVGPRTIEHVGAGEHSVRIQDAGLNARAQMVTVLADQVVRVEVALDSGSAGRPGLLWPRVGLNVAVTAGGLALGGSAIYQWVWAQDAYEHYLAAPDDAEAEQIFDDFVRPRRTATVVEGVSAGVLLVAGGALWITTDLAVTPLPGGLAVQGRW